MAEVPDEVYLRVARIHDEAKFEYDPADYVTPEYRERHIDRDAESTAVGQYFRLIVETTWCEAEAAIAEPLRKQIAAYESAINWDTHCVGRAAHLEAGANLDIRATAAEDTLAEVREVVADWVADGPGDVSRVLAERVLQVIDGRPADEVRREVDRG